MTLYKYEKEFFSDDQINELFANAKQSMPKIHEGLGPYAHIDDYLKTKLGMKTPLCIQTFHIDKGYSAEWPHIDIASSVFPSIINLWFCADACPGEAFGVMEDDQHDHYYKDYFSALDRGEVADFEPLCTEDLFDKYTKIVDYQKGDAVFFDSRAVHRKLSQSPRETLVLKYIDMSDLDDKKPYNYGRIPGGPDWTRILVFDRLRFLNTLEEKKKFLCDTQHLLNSTTPDLYQQLADKAAESAGKAAPKKGWLKKLTG
jgi:hypothetical protein